MARRRKSVNDIEAQARRIEQAGGSRATRAREIANRYIDNIYGTRSMQRAVARSGQTNARGNTTDYEAIQMDRPYAQNTYTGRNNTPARRWRDYTTRLRNLSDEERERMRARFEQNIRTASRRNVRRNENNRSSRRTATEQGLNAK